MSSRASLLYGPKEPSLWDLTLGQLIDQQATKHGDRPHIVCPWQDRRFSLREVSDRSKILAKALLHSDTQYGDCVGIFAGNRYEYLETLIAAARLGCPTVSFNTTYTDSELSRAAKFTECKIIFISTRLGPRDLSKHIESLLTLPNLKSLVIIGDIGRHGGHPKVCSYVDFYQSGSYSVGLPSSASFAKAESRVQTSDVLNIQFTSGTTGNPKAAMLSHHNLINNGQIVSHCMRLLSTDTVVCPAPLFHCLAIVICWMSALAVGACLVLPSEQFDPSATIDAVISNQATVVNGVPAMFVALVDVVRKRKLKLNTVRTGFCAGSPVPPPLAAQMEDILGMKRVSNGLGMTETSPGSFLPEQTDDTQHRILSVGKVLPHSAAKIIEPSTGRILPIGERGELCVSGYNVCKGYLHNKEKTDEVMKYDSDCVRWMHTGDECYFADDGYCYITGRIKDIIIRGGENIYPAEIEAQLLSHPEISEASVLGVADERYSEVVACFLRTSGTSTTRPTDEEVRKWVGAKLSRQKVPKFIFWIGDEGIGEFPKTGSGKIQKYELSKIAQRMLKKQRREEQTGKPKL